MTYSGLCVGGPANGKRISQPTTSFRAREREPQKVGVTVMPGDDVLVTDTEYKWLSLNKHVSLWTPVGQSLDQTMLMLATHYRPEEE